MYQRIRTLKNERHRDCNTANYLDMNCARKFKKTMNSKYAEK